MANGSSQINWLPAWLKDGVAPLLAIIIVVGGFLIIVYRPEAKTEIVALMMAVISFYFGSSKSSQAKDASIDRQLEAKDEVIASQLKAQ